MRWVYKSAAIVAGFLIALIGFIPAHSAHGWTEVELENGQWGPGATTFDPETGRLFMVYLHDDQIQLVLAAYEPGESTPVWRRNFSPSPCPSYECSFGADALLVVPGRDTVYVSGGLRHGLLGQGEVSSSGYVYAFDTRTGRQLWSHAERLKRGAGGRFTHLVKGPNGSVIAVARKYIGGEDNQSASYAPRAAAFGRSGEVRWRWADREPGVTNDVTTAGGRVVMVGDTYIDGWAKGHRIALDASNGSLAWRRLNLEHVEYFYSVAGSRDGRTVYIGGEDRGRFDEDQIGYEAALQAVSMADGRITWTQRVGEPRTEEEYYFPRDVVATSEGPCFTGGHIEHMPITFNKIYPDDGFIACYSPRGRSLWIDEEAGGQGQVLAASGTRLLWMGHQETSTDLQGNSKEVVRFEVRSLRDGSVAHSSTREDTHPGWTPTQPLFAFRHSGGIHFVYRPAPKRREDGTTEFGGITDRILH